MQTKLLKKTLIASVYYCVLSVSDDTGKPLGRIRAPIRATELPADLAPADVDAWLEQHIDSQLPADGTPPGTITAKFVEIRDIENQVVVAQAALDAFNAKAAAEKAALQASIVETTAVHAEVAEHLASATRAHKATTEQLDAVTKAHEAKVAASAVLDAAIAAKRAELDAAAKVAEYRGPNPTFTGVDLAAAAKP